MILLENLDSLDDDELGTIVPPLFGLGLYSKGQVAIVATITDNHGRRIKREKLTFPERWMVNLAKDGEDGEKRNEVSALEAVDCEPVCQGNPTHIYENLQLCLGMKTFNLLPAALFRDYSGQQASFWQEVNQDREDSNNPW